MPENETTTRTTVRSRPCSFKDIYLAKVTEDSETAYTVETPVKFARAIKGKISDKMTTTDIFSDDELEDSSYQYEGEIGFEVNALAPQDRALIFNNLYKNGFLVLNSDDKPPMLAVGYRFKHLNGKYTFAWRYCIKFNQGSDEEHNTEENSKPNPTTATLKATVYRRKKDHRIGIEVDESQLIAADTDAATAIQNWFAEVKELPEESVIGS